MRRSHLFQGVDGLSDLSDFEHLAIATIERRYEVLRCFVLVTDDNAARAGVLDSVSKEFGVAPLPSNDTYARRLWIKVLW